MNRLNVADVNSRVPAAARAALAAAALLIAACGQDSPEPQTPAAPVSDRAPEPATAAPSEIEPQAPEASAGPVTYVPLAATVFLGDEAIEILVPEGMTVPEGSLIEYREGPDGKYYFESLLPQ